MTALDLFLEPEPLAPTGALSSEELEALAAVWVNGKTLPATAYAMLDRVGAAKQHRALMHEILRHTRARPAAS